MFEIVTHNSNNARLLHRALFFVGWIVDRYKCVSQSCNIVYAYIIIFSKHDHSVKGYYYFSVFVFAVVLLGCTDDLSDLSLSQIMILSQILKSSVVLFYNNPSLFSCIL